MLSIFKGEKPERCIFYSLGETSRPFQPLHTRGQLQIGLHCYFGDVLIECTESLNGLGHMATNHIMDSYLGQFIPKIICNPRYQLSIHHSTEAHFHFS